MKWDRRKPSYFELHRKQMRQVDMYGCVCGGPLTGILTMYILAWGIFFSKNFSRIYIFSKALFSLVCIYMPYNMGHVNSVDSGREIISLM